MVSACFIPAEGSVTGSHSIHRVLSLVTAAVGFTSSALAFNAVRNLTFLNGELKPWQTTASRYNIAQIEAPGFDDIWAAAMHTQGGDNNSSAQFQQALEPRRISELTELTFHYRFLPANYDLAKLDYFGVDLADTAQGDTLSHVWQGSSARNLPPETSTRGIILEDLPQMDVWARFTCRPDSEWSAKHLSDSARPNFIRFFGYAGLASGVGSLGQTSRMDSIALITPRADSNWSVLRVEYTASLDSSVYRPLVTVKNTGAVDAGGLARARICSGADTVYDETSVVALDVDVEQTVEFPSVQLSPGEYVLEGMTSLSGDQDTTDDRKSLPLTVSSVDEPPRGNRGIQPRPVIAVGHGWSVAFRLPERACVRLAVHDASGRLVYSRVAPGQAPGIHRVTWNGKDRQGRLVPPGIYFVRLTAGPVFATAKLVMLE